MTKKILLIILALLLGFSMVKPTYALEEKTTGLNLAERYRNEITAYWNADYSALKYKVKLYNSKGKLKTTRTVYTNHITIKKPLKNNKKYKIKVRAIDIYGNKSKWSNKLKFKTQKKRFYHNKKYGFSLTLPETWKGYKVEKIIYNDGGEDISFQLYSNVMKDWYTMFTISVVDYTSYYYYPDYYYGEMLNNNSDYAYLYYHAQDTASDLYERAWELDDIVSTFNIDLY